MTKPGDKYHKQPDQKPNTTDFEQMGRLRKVLEEINAAPESAQAILRECGLIDESGQVRGRYQTPMAASGESTIKETALKTISYNSKPGRQVRTLRPIGPPEEEVEGIRRAGERINATAESAGAFLREVGIIDNNGRLAEGYR